MKCLILVLRNIFILKKQKFAMELGALLAESNVRANTRAAPPLSCTRCRCLSSAIVSLDRVVGRI